MPAVSCGGHPRGAYNVSPETSHPKLDVRVNTMTTAEFGAFAGRLLVLFAAAHILGFLFTKVRQPRVVGEILAGGHSQDWLDRLDAAEVPCAPVLRRADVMDNVQVINNALIELMEQPSMGTVRQPRPAARFDRTPAGIGGPAPRIGEHTDAVLAEVGYSAAEIEAMKQSRAAKSTS